MRSVCPAATRVLREAVPAPEVRRGHRVTGRDARERVAALARGSRTSAPAGPS